MTRYDRTSADTPVAVDDREIGMADAAILDDTLDLLGADLPDRIQKVQASASDHSSPRSDHFDVLSAFILRRER